MSTLSTSTTENGSPVGSYQPTDIDGVPIIYDGTSAKILGKLRAAQQYYERTGHFKEYIENQSVLIGSKLAIESWESLPFVKGVITDLPAGEKYDFANPCPPTPGRVSLYNEKLRLADPQSPGLVVATDHAELINNYRYSVIVQPGAVVKEGRAFAASLIQIVSDVDQANAFLQAADFDGNKLIDVLMRESYEADGEEIALVTQEYTQFIGTPFRGALSLETFNTKYKAFKEVLSCQPNEKDPSEVIGILKLWMRSDTDIRQQYQILCMQQDCKVDLEAHLKQMRKLLRSVKTTAQVDALQAGRSNTTLVVKTIEEVPAPDSIALLSAVKSAMSMTKGKKRSKAVLDALIAHGVDPVKGMKGKEKDKKKGNGNVEIPRNPDGSVSKWVVGMALCKCKGEGSPTGADDGGKHLYKHCKKADTSPPDRQVANVVEIKTGMSDDEWNSAFSGFFDHISNPCVLLDPSNNSEIAIDASIVSMAGEYISDDISTLAVNLGVDRAYASAIHAEAVEAHFSASAPFSLLDASYADLTRRVHTAPSSHVQEACGHDHGPWGICSASSPPPPLGDRITTAVAVPVPASPAPALIATSSDFDAVGAVDPLGAMELLHEQLRAARIRADCVAAENDALRRLYDVDASAPPPPPIPDGERIPEPSPPPVKHVVCITSDDASARFCDAPEAGEGGAVLPHPSESRSFTDLSPEGLAATAKQIVGSSCSASILTTDNASAIDLDSTKGSDDLGTKTKHEPSPGESKTDKPIEKVVPENTEVTDTDLLLSTIKYASYKLTCQMAKKITATTSSFVSRNHGIIIAVLVVLLGMSMAGGFAASATSSNIAAPPPDHVAAISANSIRYLDAAADYEPPSNSTLFDPLPPSRTRLRRGPLDTISWLLCSWFSIIGTIALISTSWAALTLIAFAFNPISSIISLAYAALLPVIAVAPSSSITWLANRNIFKHSVTALNRVRGSLPWVVTIALALSTSFMPPAHSPGSSLPSDSSMHLDQPSSIEAGLAELFSPEGVMAPSTHVDLPYMTWLQDSRTPQACHNSTNSTLGRAWAATSLSSTAGLGAMTVMFGASYHPSHVSLPSPNFTASAVKHGKVMEASKSSGLPFEYLVVDSGCSASSVSTCSILTNVRPCDEIFGDANGRVSKATHIGDLPVVTRTKSKELVDFTLTNVRCVPGFKYNLISVTQIWDEQRIDARWRDLRHLEFPSDAGGHQIGYDPSFQLSTITVVPGAKVGRGGRRPIEELQATCRASALATNAPSADQTSLVGYHRVGSTSHIRNMSVANASAYLHRRLHCGTRKLRSAANASRDAPSNLSSAIDVTCPYCAVARSKSASHSSTLKAPAPQPGTLHTDLKGPFPTSIGGYKYCMFFTDEHTRYCWVELLKTKETSEMLQAVKKVTANFSHLVYTPQTEDGKALPKPMVTAIHSDHESALNTKAFEALCANDGFVSTKSPPYDHDLNPIAERINRTIPEVATAAFILSGASHGFWPWFIRHAVHVHNSLQCAVGSSTADASISPHQRFTLTLPKLMHLSPPGCAAVVNLPTPKASKTGLQPRGVEGIFLGPANSSIDSSDVWIPSENRIMTSSAVDVDEDTYPWRGADAHQPLPVQPSAAPQHAPLVPHVTSDDEPPVNGTSPPTWSKPASVNEPRGTRGLNFLSLFHGPYDRLNGLPSKLKDRGWSWVIPIDNDVERGGGHNHDLLNDQRFTMILEQAKSGHFDTILVAFPCSTFSAARFYDASRGDPSKDRGPLPVRTHTHPDGLPDHLIQPGHKKELADSNKLLKRSVDICIAAYESPRKTTIIWENPIDRSDEASVAYSEDLKDHGSLFATTEFIRLRDTIGLNKCSTCTFAACMLGSKHQKYTTLFYTNDAASVLDSLNASEYKCNHPREYHEPVGGQLDDGTWASGNAAAYSDKMNDFLADAATLARTGSTTVQTVPGLQPTSTAPVILKSQPQLAPAPHHSPHTLPPEPQPEPSPRILPVRGRGYPRSPVAFRGYTDTPSVTSSAHSHSAVRPSPAFVPPASPVSAIDLAASQPRSYAVQDKSTRSVRSTTQAASHESEQLADSRSRARHSRIARGHTLGPINEDEQLIDPSYVGFTNSPHYSNESIDLMESTVAELIFDSQRGTDTRTEPVSNWINTSLAAEMIGSARRIDHDTYEIEIDLEQATDSHLSLLAEALGESEQDMLNSYQSALLSESTSKSMSILDFLPIHQALRADSSGAPNNHAEAVKMGGVWPSAEEKELGNHDNLGSFVKVKRSEVPRGRRVHKLVWVYKLKRDGTAKARLCVQGCTLEGGIDYDQTFASALKYCSARGLFAFAARNGCKIRSIDFVAAYLQSEFVEGEVVYVHMPDGYVEKDDEDRPYVLKVVKPVYGIQQSGRRLQRKVIPWCESIGLRQLDDSDNCVWVYDDPDGKETFAMGVYVDNLQVVHSATLDEDGEPVDKDSFYAKFLTRLRKDWDIVDEGEMVDLLGIQVIYHPDGSITLHQEKYINAMIDRFYPRGLPNHVKNSGLPFSSKIRERVIEALDVNAEGCIYPELVTDYQQRVGSLMYCCTASRVDVAYPVHLLCRCMTKPTPELMLEIDHVFAYLLRHRKVGITFDSKTSSLKGFSDASWEVRNSTSGWLCMWQSAPLTWGSAKQKCTALSSCEAEIIALSEASKDMVYFRKFLKGLDPSYITEPSYLATDNQAARDLSYNPEHHSKTKHVERRHFYIRDMVEALELRVPLVGTKDNWADFLTKPLEAKTFFALRAMIMNEKVPFNPSKKEGAAA